MRLLVGSLVGALILFVWSAISWMASPLHSHTFMHTAAQDSVLAAMSKIHESGAYMLPMGDNSGADADYKKMQQVHEANTGKPAALVFYSTVQPEMGGGMFVVGILCDWMMALLVFGLVAAAGGNQASFGKRWAVAFTPALTLIFAAWLVMWNWMSFPMSFLSGIIIDAIVAFALLATWMAWWQGRK